MADRESVVAKIHVAFDGVAHPGDAFLQGSGEGSEPGRPWCRSRYLAEEDERHREDKER